MPAQLNDKIYAERLGIPGGITVGDVVSLARLNWSFLTDTWSETPQNLATIAAGDVWSYSLLGVTRYRLVPSPYDPTLDAFYSDFDGVNLTGLIAARG